MPSGEDGRKRLKPPMTRGGFRLQLVLCALLTINPIRQIVSRLNEPWGTFEYVAVAVLALCVAFFAYLLYVRRHDGQLWDEEEARRKAEEARRADWDRRGRRL